MKLLKSKPHEKGTILLAVLPLALVAGGFILLSSTTARSYLKEQDSRHFQRTALNEANSSMAIVQSRVKSSAYVGNQNQVLLDAVATGSDTGYTNSEGNAVKVMYVGNRSEVWISALADGWYQLDALGSVNGRRTQIRTLVRERDPFSRFNSFVNSHPLGVGGRPRGDIHTNRVLQLFYSGGYYEDPVSARDGFEWLVGATPENTTFAGGANDSHPNIDMPTVSTIGALSSKGDGALEALLAGRDAADYEISVTLKGRAYDIVAVKNDGTETLQALDLGFPSSGVLYFDTDLAGLEGTLDARATIAVTGEITLTGSLRYIDENGEPIYKNGLSTDPDNEPYEPNPAYTGNAALGVIANGDILYDHAIDDYIEMNAFFFSATGRYGLPGLTFTSDGRYATGYDSSFQKESYRRLGGIATDLRIVSTVVNGSGTVLSGFQHGASAYDTRLRSEPPPFFLAFDRPVFSSYRIVNGTLQGAGSGEGDGYPVGDRPIGSYEAPPTP